MTLYLAKLIIMGIGLGLATGVGAYTFWYGKGYSYLSNDPGSCANCHIMNEQYDGWLKSSHKAVATCNDCHTPPDTFGRYYTKASNGFWHSYYFTVGGFHEPIRINERNREVAEASCRHCHQTMVHSITVSEQIDQAEQVSCIMCHRDVGHMH
ncbi:MAG TPA: cytochrome c nitrite reductase small subunit [Pyrinomonadaceae bacterium]|nr:cytochrome c nitrite reductase small subunit [Pyrinomonadaceae bacterium]